MPLLDRNGARADEWIVSEDGERIGERIIVGLGQLDAALQANGPLGLFIENTTKAASLAPFLDRLDLIVIAFPSYGDGRGFSIAKQLRNMGYRGALRARGPLIADQFAYALECGFDEVDLPEEMERRQPVEQWLAMARTITATYQRGYRARNILDARRAARG